MKPLKLEISFSVEIYDKNNLLENGQNFYVAEKRTVFKLLQISISLAQIEDLNQDCVQNSRPYP